MHLYVQGYVNYGCLIEAICNFQRSVFSITAIDFVRSEFICQYEVLYKQREMNSHQVASRLLFKRKCVFEWNYLES